MYVKADERERLGLAGRRKLEEYRQLKAALLHGDLHTALAQSSSFSNSSSSTPAVTTQPNVFHTLQHQQGVRHQQQSADDVDPMVDLLLAQVRLQKLAPALHIPDTIMHKLFICDPAIHEHSRVVNLPISQLLPGLHCSVNPRAKPYGGFLLAAGILINV